MTILGNTVGLTLADGSKWLISNGNAPASNVVTRLAEIMQLEHQHGSARRLLVVVNGLKPDSEAGTAPTTVWDSEPMVSNVQSNSQPLVSFSKNYLSSEDENDVICNLSPTKDKYRLTIQLIQLSSMLAQDAENRNGLMLHAGLAEWKGNGVILAGPGGVGKTTASQRLPQTWRSLCDDNTLVVRSEQGTYWAHPWPTWSRILPGGFGATWDVQHAIPLRGIFFLAQSEIDRVVPVGAGRATCLLLESTGQIWWGAQSNAIENELRLIRLRRFDNGCMLAQAVPCYELHLSKTGTFWQEIEHVIDNS